MDRYWLLTWTTYGTWLPGDRRGFVSNVADGPGPEVRHNMPGTPFDADDDGVRQRALNSLIGRPVWLSAEQAAIALPQFRETAAYRGWALLAAAVMANHVHLVVGVPNDPDPAKLLHDFKSYATRALTKHGHLPAGARWWTESGSRRKLPNEDAVDAAVEYVLRQQRVLAVWSVGNRGTPTGERGVPTGERGVLTPCEGTPAGERGVLTPCEGTPEPGQGVHTPRSPGVP